MSYFPALEGEEGPVSLNLDHCVRERKMEVGERRKETGGWDTVFLLLKLLLKSIFFLILARTSGLVDSETPASALLVFLFVCFALF